MEGLANMMAKPDLPCDLPMARTDGRTNGRPTHLIESSSVPERAGENREIRILTVRQPWAWAIINGGKDVENRVRNIAGNWRGTIAIHAGLGYDEDAVIWHGDQPFAVDDDGSHREPRGAIIGVVGLVGVHFGPFAERWDAENEHNARCTPWADADRFHLELANPRPLSEPIPYRGALGLRRLPDDVADAVRNAVAS